MKRITALLLVLVMIVPLALMSCDKDDSGTLPPAGGTGTNCKAKDAIALLLYN